MEHKVVGPVTYRSFTQTPGKPGAAIPSRPVNNALDVINPVTGDIIQCVLKPFPKVPQS